MLYEIPEDGQKKYIVESPCATVAPSGSIKPITAVPDCAKVTATTARDSAGLYVLFSVDKSACPGSDGAAGAPFPAAAVGASVAVIIIVAVAAAVAFVYLRNKNMEEVRKAIKKKLSLMNRTHEPKNNSTPLLPLQTSGTGAAQEHEGYDAPSSAPASATVEDFQPPPRSLEIGGSSVGAFGTMGQLRAPLAAPGERPLPIPRGASAGEVHAAQNHEAAPKRNRPLPQPPGQMAFAPPSAEGARNYELSQAPSERPITYSPYQ